jgi:GTP-binding protein LepA
VKQTHIRNFAIIAHIDHGKSTLADRIMEQTKTVSERESKDQLLDNMEVEQAHGITVKSRTVRNYYRADNGEEYDYNFIDTPGHVDFSYEVSKSLAASDGAILLVDATQGVQAQTVANFRLAKQNGLTIIPVINKIDSETADVNTTAQQIRQLDPIFNHTKILEISAKTGQNVHDVLEAIYQEIPAPTGQLEKPLKALVFDSLYDPFKGIVAYVRLYDGQLKAGQHLKLMADQTGFTSHEVGAFAPDMKQSKQLSAGDVGYVVTGLKDPQLIRVGDTLTESNRPADQALPGYQPAKSMVFAGFYPKDDHYKELKAAVEKLALNDSSFHYVEETSDALGPGFRCGFLGMLHLQIIRERLNDEYQVAVLTTAPNSTYQVYLKDKRVETPLIVTNPVKFPDFSKIDYVEESFVKAVMTTPSASLGPVMRLADNHLGTLLDMNNHGDLVELVYKLPISEIAYDFFNELKSESHGYATLDTSFLDYELADVVKIGVHINYAPVDALDVIVHRQDAEKIAQGIVKKMKYTVPRRLYPMPVQAFVERKSIARIDVPPLRKNAAVNGDKRSISKKQQLLRRQNVNKRQAARSDIELPQEVFNAILELD